MSSNDRSSFCHNSVCEWINQLLTGGAGSIVQKCAAQKIFPSNMSSARITPGTMPSHAQSCSLQWKHEMILPFVKWYWLRRGLKFYDAWLEPSCQYFNRFFASIDCSVWKEREAEKSFTQRREKPLRQRRGGGKNFGFWSPLPFPYPSQKRQQKLKRAKTEPAGQNFTKKYGKDTRKELKIVIICLFP